MLAPAPAPTHWPTAEPITPPPLDLLSALETGFSPAQLRELARWLGEVPKGNTRVGLAKQIAPALQARIARTEQTPEALLEGLTEEQQALARRLLTACDHRLPFARSLAAALWRSAPERAARPQLDALRHVSEIAEGLHRRALLFPTAPSLYHDLNRDVYYRWLPLGDARPPVMQWRALLAKDAGDVPASRPSFIESFEAFLQAVSANSVTLHEALPPHPKASQLPWLSRWEHDAEEAERVLRSRVNWVPDPSTGIGVPLRSALSPASLFALENCTGFSAPQLEFFFAIACALQLIEPPSNPSMPLSVRSQALEEWLMSTPAQKLRRAWWAWSERIMAGLEAHSAAANANPAFRVMRAIGGRTFTPAVLAAEWCALRRYVLRVLRGLPANQWIDWPSLSAQLFEFHPECLWQVATPAHWWLAWSSNNVRLRLSQAEEWQASVGRIIAHIIRDSLAWFGAVEVRTARDGQLDAFRITRLGIWLLEGQSDALPAEALPKPRAVERVRWLDERTLRVPPGPERAELIALLRRTALNNGTPFSYAFTPESVERGLTAGVSLEELDAQLRRHDVRLTPAVAHLFSTLASRLGRVRVYPALAVLELADPIAAQELMASTDLKAHVLYQVSPCAFILRQEDLEALIAQIQQKGYMPRVIG
jgi:hypothetical protein